MVDNTIHSYPDLVDAIWELVKGTDEQRERSNYRRSEQQVAEALGLQWAFSDDACADGVAQAISDLVDLGYCVGRGTYNGSRYMAVSPAPDAPGMPPSAYIMRDGLSPLPDLRARVLRFIHEQSLRQESRIVFYTDVRILYSDAILTVLPDRIDDYAAIGDIVEAVRDLKQQGYLRGTITTGGFHMHVTMQGASWLQFGAPLLDLVSRATRLTDHPEALEAARIVMEAHTRSERDAARDITVAIEKLENAVGGERGLISFLSRPPIFVKGLKQSAQTHRHANSMASEILNHTQRLMRAREIVDLYITKTASSS